MTDFNTRIRERINAVRKNAQRYGMGASEERDPRLEGIAADAERMADALLAILGEHEYDEHGFCRTCVRWENDDEGYPVMHRVGVCPTARGIAVHLGLREPEPKPCPFEGGGVCRIDPAKHWHYLRPAREPEAVLYGSEREREIREYEDQFRHGDVL